MILVFYVSVKFREKFCLRAFKVARTYLYACSLCFWIVFLGRNDLTDFHDLGILNKEW